MKNLISNFVFNSHPLLVGMISTIVIVGGFTSVIVLFNWSLGVSGFGPKQEIQATVQRLYVDSSKEKSHYMVGTDKGVYEITNMLVPIQIFNADELYSKLEIGKTYKITTKGNKVLNPIVQEYPYIITIE